MRIAIFVSGGGTNLQAVMDQIREGKLEGIEIVKVISSKDGAYAQQRAANANIPVAVIQRKNFPSLKEYDAALVDSLKNDAVDLVVLAGFLSFLGPDFIHTYENKIINVHPALIPSFCGEGMYGLKPHIAALERGVKVTGATVHFINEEYDSGPIILQKAVEIRDDDTPEELQQRVMKEAEQVILPEAIRLIAAGAVEIMGRKTRIRKS